MLKNQDEENFKKYISTKLRNLRKIDCQIKQEELAELANISVDTVSNIEREKATPNLYTFVKLCNALKVNPNYILKDYLNRD